MPFATKVRKRINVIAGDVLLTTGSMGLIKVDLNLWIHLYGVLFLLSGFMSLIHQFVHPFSEFLLLQRVDQVGDVGSWQVFYFPFGNWKCFHDVWKLFSPL